ncbi:MAG: hypothetical protein QOJ73_1555 [Streptosporangiaceae bacterium]|jgi:hypothetical protein|nr:hypothetical protein [Streptosporangiaceae bacterium]
MARMRGRGGWRGQKLGCLGVPRALIAVTLAISLLTVAGCEGAPGSGRRLSSVSCAPHVLGGVLPSWARAGFSEPNPGTNYELGRNRDIAAILFKNPLLAPPSATAHNKILWASRVSVSGSPLLIDAQRMVGSRLVGAALRRRVDGGPGPSYINLPVGCWRLTLRWSGHSDSLDVRYVPNTA